MPVENPISDAQASYLRSLAKTHMIWPEHTPAQVAEKVEAFVSAGITKEAASALIDQALAAPRYAAAQIPASDWEIRRVRELATESALFGLTVSVEETIARVEAAIAAPLFSSEEARTLIHAGYRAAPHPTAQTPLRLSDIDGIENLHVSEGHYAVFDPSDTLRYYRIYTPATGALKGVGVIRRIAGNTLRGLYPDEARLVLRTINNDPDAAAYRYSDTFTCCFICGRHLTDAVSRLLSVGPTCRGFANHTGLRLAAGEVDHDPERRQVYRAIRQWALDSGFSDPRTKAERGAMTMTASRVGSAWSGIPGLLSLSPDDAITVVRNAHTGEPLPDLVRDGLLAAPKDTLLILISSGVLSQPVLELLTEHPIEDVRAAAGTYFLHLLGMGAR